MNLYAASNQWANRPADERFASLDALYAAMFGVFNSRQEAEYSIKQLKIVPTDTGELHLMSPSGGTCRFTNFGFGQFCGLMKYSKSIPGLSDPITASAPGGFVRCLPPDLAALVLNYGIIQAEDKNLQLLLHRGEGSKPMLRAANGQRYSRYWNYEVVRFLQSLPRGWRVPPARPSTNSDPSTVRRATQADVLDAGNFGLAIRVGDPIAPAGIYASDHEMFVFMVNEDKQLKCGSENLNRGFFVTNDEVGAGSIKFTCFLYDNVCGNHIVWGAKNVFETRLSHIGDGFRNKVNAAVHEMVKYADRPAHEDEQRLITARNTQLGNTKEQVIEMVYDKHGWVSKRQANAAYELAERFESVHGNPRSVWGFVSGLTRYSQQTPFADQRDAIDRAAAKIMQYAVVR